MFYLMNHSTHFIYGYMASDIRLRTILIVRKETRCRHIGYSYRLTARVLIYAPSHRQDSTYHSLCYSMIWNRTIQIPREETAATTWATLFNLGFFLYAPSHWQDSTHYLLCYTSHGALAATRNTSMSTMRDGSNDPLHHGCVLIYGFISLQWMQGILSKNVL